jgi:hypothetical protein
MIFLNPFDRGLYQQGEGGAGVLLPDGQIFRGNRQPAEREKIPARFGNSANLSPVDFMYFDLVDFGIDHVTRPADSKRKEGRSPLP